MKQINSIAGIHSYCNEVSSAGKSLGLVPTMGALHNGHLSLMTLAKRSCDVVVASIFVNPTQFAPNEDFARYPRDLDSDLKLCEGAGVSAVFAPEPGEVYPGGFSTYVSVEQISSVLEGSSRPDHFRGVTTVVAKLFLLTKPQKAFFGQKDAQQCAVIKKMVKDLNFDVEIVVAPIVREVSGLAMSSRNRYLSDAERLDAAVLFSSLRRAEEMVAGGERNVPKVVAEMTRLIGSKRTASIDYVKAVHAESLGELTTFDAGVPVLIAVAVRFGTTRLIDNTVITLR